MKRFSLLIGLLMLAGCCHGASRHGTGDDLDCLETVTMYGETVCTLYRFELPFRRSFPPCRYASGTILGEPVNFPTNGPCQP